MGEKWPIGPYPGRLAAFARRQDCDDIACFAVEGNQARRVVVIEGWYGDSYLAQAEYETFWIWLKSVIDDVAGWVETSTS